MYTYTHGGMYLFIYAIQTYIHTSYIHTYIYRGGGPSAGEFFFKKKTYIYRGGPSTGETGAPQGRGRPRGQEGGAGASSCVKFARAP